MTQCLTQACCSMACLARHTEDAATSEGRYLRKGSECIRASSHKYCRQRVKAQQITNRYLLWLVVGEVTITHPKSLHATISIYLCKV